MIWDDFDLYFDFERYPWHHSDEYEPYRQYKLWNLFRYNVSRAYRFHLFYTETVTKNADRNVLRTQNALVTAANTISGLRKSEDGIRIHQLNQHQDLQYAFVIFYYAREYMKTHLEAMDRNKFNSLSSSLAIYSLASLKAYSGTQRHYLARIVANDLEVTPNYVRATLRKLKFRYSDARSMGIIS